MIVDYCILTTIINETSAKLLVSSTILQHVVDDFQDLMSQCY